MFCTNPECPDVTRSGSAGEYRDDVTICPKCGFTLSREPPQPIPEPVPEMLPGDDRGFVVVARLNSAPSLVVARSMLDEAGIRHFVRNQQSFSPWGGSGGAGILGLAELAVEPDRADEAERLLSRVQEAVPEVDGLPFEDGPDEAISILQMGEQRKERQRSSWTGRQLAATPSLARVVFFSVASVLFFSAVVIGLLQSERVNGFWLFLGVTMAIVALDTQRRRRQADK